MQSPPTADSLTDSRRLAALRRAALLDTPAEESFDRYTRLAARLIGAPVALVSLVDEDRQFFKSQCGLPEPWASRRGTPLSHSFCQHAVQTAEPLVIEDARDHPLVRDNLAIPDLGVIAYAGWPLVTRDGDVLGSFCVIDTQPRAWTEVELETLRDLAGAVTTEIELRTQVAERDADRRALEGNEARVRGILGSLPGMLWLNAPDGSLEYFNEHWYDYTGWERDSAALWSWADVVHPEERGWIGELRSRAIATGRPYQAELRMRRADGVFRWHSARVVPIRDDQGALTGWVGSAMDVDDLKRAESAQRYLVRSGDLLAISLDARQTLEAAARAAIDGLADNCIVEMTVEDGAARRFAIAAPEETAGILHELVDRYPVPPEEWERMNMRPTEAEARRMPQPGSVALEDLARDGEHLELLTRLGPHHVLTVGLIAAGRRLGIMVLARHHERGDWEEADLPVAQELARKTALSLENARLFDEARRAVELRDEVLGIVSHDLRNPVGTVFTSASFLLDLVVDPAETKVREQLELIRRASERANRLIQDLLDVSRIEAGGLSIDPEPIDPGALLDEVVEGFRAEAALVEVQLRCDVGDGLPLAMADRGRLHQVLSNLVGNALKFTGRGGTVRVEAEPVEGELRFRVADTGIGIAPDALPHVFDRFWQATHADRRGAGLGLAICRGIVEAHGGRIWAESRLGEGSVFHFALPLTP